MGSEDREEVGEVVMLQNEKFFKRRMNLFFYRVFLMVIMAVLLVLTTAVVVSGWPQWVRFILTVQCGAAVGATGYRMIVSAIKG